MRIRHLKSAVAETDMTPMIDMTFQLIAFFMIVTNFEQTQADERVRLPADELAVPPDQPRDNALVVNIGYVRDETTGKKLDPEPYIFPGGTQKIPILASAPYFERERQQHVYRHGAESLGEVNVEIRADSSVPTGLIQELMKIAQEVGNGQGFTNFSLKAKVGDEESQ